MGPEALLRQKVKQRRHRGGYEDGVSTLRKIVPALAFLASSAPVEMLGQVWMCACVCV
jgi:AdoMet-dependent rRNA methyltransferase SPB1